MLSIGKHVPNALSFFRLGLTPLLVLLLLEKYSFNFMDANLHVRFAFFMMLYWIGSFTDFLDGYLARTYGWNSQFGVFIDPLIDKIFTLSLFIACLYYEAISLPAIAIWLIAFREIFITALRIFALKKKYSLKTETHGKIKTISQIVLQNFIFIAIYLNLLAANNLNNEIMYSATTLNIICYIGTYVVCAISLYSGWQYIATNRGIFTRNNG